MRTNKEEYIKYALRLQIALDKAAMGEGDAEADAEAKAIQDGETEGEDLWYALSEDDRIWIHGLLGDLTDEPGFCDDDCLWDKVIITIERDNWEEALKLVRGLTDERCYRYKLMVRYIAYSKLGYSNVAEYFWGKLN